MSCVVSAIANSVRNTATARLANSLSSVRWKIMLSERLGRFTAGRKSCDHLRRPMRVEYAVEFSIKSISPERAKSGCLVLGVHAGGALTRAAQLADRAARGALRAALAQGDLSGKAGSTLLLRGVAGLAAERVLLVGLGDEKELGESAYRDALLYLAETKPAGRDPAWSVRQAVLVVSEAFYRFDQLKTQKKALPPALAAVTLAQSAGPVTRAAQGALAEATAVAQGAELARTLGNLPPNICTPSYLADEAKKLARRFKLTVEVLERRDMEKLGMGALLAVTRGSHQPPKLIVLRYHGAARTNKPVVLVGKGITFDTGGISLK